MSSVDTAFSQLTRAVWIRVTRSSAPGRIRTCGTRFRNGVAFRVGLGRSPALAYALLIVLVEVSPHIVRISALA